MASQSVDRYRSWREAVTEEYIASGLVGICTHQLTKITSQVLTIIDPHEDRGKVLAKGVVLEMVKQRVCPPLNTRGHDKEDLEGRRGQVRLVGGALDEIG